MLRITAFLSLAILVGALSSAQSADRHETLLAAFEEIRRDHSIPALGVGIIDGGEIVFVETLGAPGEARFRTASLSKLLTAQATMQLVEAGKLSLDDDVVRYVPAFAKRGITIRQLLTHRSGLAEAVKPIESEAADRVAANVAALARSSPASDPGTRWAYTDAEFNLLGAIIEAVSGEAYPDYIRQHLFAPLGIERASLFPLAAQRGDILGAHLNLGFAISAPERPFDIAFAPSEGLVTGTGDLTHWLQATLLGDPRLLRSDSYAAMLKPDAADANAGLGWQLGNAEGRPKAQHGGSFIGHSALVLVYPAMKRGFVILANAHEVPRWEIVSTADAILDGREYRLPASSRSKYLAAWIFLALLLVAAGWGLTKRLRKKS